MVEFRVDCLSHRFTRSSSKPTRVWYLDMGTIMQLACKPGDIHFVIIVVEGLLQWFGVDCFRFPLKGAVWEDEVKFVSDIYQRISGKYMANLQETSTSLSRKESHLLDWYGKRMESRISSFFSYTYYIQNQGWLLGKSSLNPYRIVNRLHSLKVFRHRQT